MSNKPCVIIGLWQKLIDLTGQRFGKWIVVKFIGGKLAKWECQCDCGNVKKVQGQNLRERISTQCKSCSIVERHARDRARMMKVGDRFGRWTVLEVKPLRCFVECDCGARLWRASQSVRLGTSKQCAKCGTSPRLAFGEAAFRQTVNAYRTAAKKNGRCWELTDDEVRLLFALPCSYCGKLPNEDPVSCKKEATKGMGGFVYNGIDRRDNDKGYTTENAITCCIVCNRAKHAMSLDMFITWITRLRAHNQVSPEVVPNVVTE